MSVQVSDERKETDYGLEDASILICLDFDLTLTQFHTFHYVIDSIKSGFSREEAILRAIKLLKSQGPRGGDLLWYTLAECLNKGHGITITTFTAFPELAQSLLASGLSKARPLLQERQMSRWLSRPLVIFGDPAPNYNPPHQLPNTQLISQTDLSKTQVGKNLHIEAAKAELLARGYTYNQVLLVDDDPNNIDLATKAGHLVISVDAQEKEGSHLKQLSSLLSL